MWHKPVIFCTVQPACSFTQLSPFTCSTAPENHACSCLFFSYVAASSRKTFLLSGPVCSTESSLNYHLKSSCSLQLLINVKHHSCSLYFPIIRSSSARILFWHLCCFWIPTFSFFISVSVFVHYFSCLEAQVLLYPLISHLCPTNFCKVLSHITYQRCDVKRNCFTWKAFSKYYASFLLYLMLFSSLEQIYLNRKKQIKWKINE